MKNAGPTKFLLDYFKETSKNLFDLGVTLLIDPDSLIKEYKYSYNYNWVSGLKKGSSFEYKNNKIYLTDKGRVKIIKNIIKDKNKNKQWDGKWRAIIFDIPEASRRERRFLRTELKWMKFKELQKSIWICPHNIESELFALLKLWKIDFRGDIRFLRIDKITEDGDIRKRFNL